MGRVRSNRKIEKKNRGCWLSWNDCCRCKVACWHERNFNFYPGLVLSKQRSCRPKSRSILQVNLDGTRETRRTRDASAFLRGSWQRVYFPRSFALSLLKARNLRLNSTNKTRCLINFYALDLWFISFIASRGNIRCSISWIKDAFWTDNYLFLSYPLESDVDSLRTQACISYSPLILLLQNSK